MPAGKYICEIKGAKEVATKTGKKQLVLQLDIAEGEYKDYYSNQYAANFKRTGQVQSGITADCLDKVSRVISYRILRE